MIKKRNIIIENLDSTEEMYENEFKNSKFSKASQYQAKTIKPIRCLPLKQTRKKLSVKRKLIKK